MRVRFEPEADDELDQAAAYLSDQSSDAARFLADVADTIDLLLQFLERPSEGAFGA